MIRRPYKIAIAGTHSTGKTTFMERLAAELADRQVRVEYVHDSAAAARDIGFPILSEHTFESTAWLMARAIELETVASLSAEVILIDRPVHDALGYLCAALRHSKRELEQARLRSLELICHGWAAEYDLLFLTRLDETIAIGGGRDGDTEFRKQAAISVSEVIERFIPNYRLIESGGQDAAIDFALQHWEEWRRQNGS